MNTTLIPTALPAEARYANRVAARLSAATVDLPHDVTERLRASREQALAVRKKAPSEVRVTAPAAVTLSNGQGTASLGGGDAGGWRGALRWLGMALPVVAMIGGLMVIDVTHRADRASEVARVDTALLADDLPPAAYTDPGFVQFLKQSQVR